MKCEEAMIMKMAEVDGEQAPSVEADNHIDGCENCRREIAAMRGLDEVFKTHTAATNDANVWPYVHQQIAMQKSPVGWQVFVIPVVALVAFRVVAMSLQNEPGLLVGLVPLAIAAVLFALLRENPFRVNTELILEK